MFRIALAAIALRMLDDNFIQPAAGTSPTDHLVSGLSHSPLLGRAAYGYERLPGFWQGALSLMLGLAASRLGSTRSTTPASSGLPPTTSPACSRSPPASALLGLGPLDALPHPQPRRPPRTGATAAAPLLGVAGALRRRHARRAGRRSAYVSTHTARAVVPGRPPRCPARGCALFRTTVRPPPAWWYVPSRNRGAVIVYPGRGRTATPRPDAHRAWLRRAALRPPRIGPQRWRADRLRVGQRARHPRGGRTSCSAVRTSTTSGSAASGCRWVARCSCTPPPRTTALQAVVSEGAGARAMRRGGRRRGAPDVRHGADRRPASRSRTPSVAVFANRSRRRRDLEDARRRRSRRARCC